MWPHGDATPPLGMGVAARLTQLLPIGIIGVIIEDTNLKSM